MKKGCCVHVLLDLRAKSKEFSENSAVREDILQLSAFVASLCTGAAEPSKFDQNLKNKKIDRNLKKGCCAHDLLPPVGVLPPPKPKIDDFRSTKNQALKTRCCKPWCRLLGFGQVWGRYERRELWKHCSQPPPQSLRQRTAI